MVSDGESITLNERDHPILNDKSELDLDSIAELHGMYDKFRNTGKV